MWIDVQNQGTFSSHHPQFKGGEVERGMESGIYLHIHFCLTRGPAGCPGPAIRTLARVLIQSFHDCAALAALPSAGVTTHCKYLQWRYCLHTHSLQSLVPRRYTHLSARYGMDLMLVRKCWCWDLQWWNVGLSADIVHLWPDLGPGEE